MNKPFIEIKADSFIIHAFEILKPNNFEFPSNYPNCCEGHKSDLKYLEEYFDKFPYCCDEHLNFFKKINFDKNTVYKNLPIRILNTCLYTEHHIKTTIQKEDWFEDITEYIDFSIRSLGQPAVGFHIYIQIIESILKNKASQIPLNKKRAILNYISELSNYTPTNEKTDLKLLFNIYQKWLDIFPFELPFFTKLKPQLSNRMPFVKEKVKSNRYLGEIAFKVVTPSELIKSLYENTLQILSLVNTVNLVKENKISDTAKLRIDFINEEHRYRQKTLLSTFSKGEKKYIKTIKDWLANEKEYFSSIVPLMNQNILPPPEKTESIRVFKINGLQASIKDKATDLHNSLVTKQYLNVESKKEFVKLFTGQTIETKISWLGQKGELKSFIDLLISHGKIENCQASKWQITAANFKFGNDDFTANTIKDTKKQKNDIKIKQIVQRIN